MRAGEKRIAKLPFMGELKVGDTQAREQGISLPDPGLGQRLSKLGHLAVSGTFLVVVTMEVLLASKDVVRYPTVHRTAPTTKDCLAPNVTGVKADVHTFQKVFLLFSFPQTLSSSLYNIARK